MYWGGVDFCLFTDVSYAPWTESGTYEVLTICGMNTCRTHKNTLWETAWCWTKLNKVTCSPRNPPSDIFHYQIQILFLYVLPNAAEWERPLVTSTAQKRPAELVQWRSSNLLSWPETNISFRQRGQTLSSVIPLFQGASSTCDILINDVVFISFACSQLFLFSFIIQEKAANPISQSGLIIFSSCISTVLPFFS